MQQRTRLYEKLHEQLARTASTATSFDSLLLDAIADIRRLLSTDKAALYVLSVDGTSLQAAAADGVDPLRLRRQRIPIGEFCTGRAAADAAPILLSRAAGLTLDDDPIAVGARSLLAVPLRRYGDVLGVLTMTLKSSSFEEAEGALLTAAVAFLAFALDAVRVRNVGRREVLRYERAYEAIPQGLLTFDAFQQVIFSNQAASHLLDLHGRPEPGTRIADLFPASFRAQLSGMLQQVQRFGLVCEDTLQMALGGGPGGSSTRSIVCTMAPFPVDPSSSRSSDGGGVAILREIHAEAQPTRDTASSSFVAMVSHELRTPLTSIKGAAHLLTEADPADRLEGHRSLINIIAKNTNRLINIVNDIIEVTQIENDALTLIPTRENLMSLIEISSEMVRPLADSRRVSISLEASGSEIVADVDKRLLLQILRHLLENAVKFSPVGRAVEVTLGADDTRATIDVRDFGEGVPPEFRPYLFRKFTQGEGVMTRRSGGNGLGLYLVKTLTELHGGTVELLHTSSDGTAFRLTLPLRH